jgi:hypothetical protein
MQHKDIEHNIHKFKTIEETLLYKLSWVFKYSLHHLSLKGGR